MVTVLTLFRSLFVFLISLGLLIFIFIFGRDYFVFNLILFSPVLIYSGISLIKMIKHKTTKLYDGQAPEESLTKTRKRKLKKIMKRNTLF